MDGVTEGMVLTEVGVSTVVAPWPVGMTDRLESTLVGINIFLPLDLFLKLA